MISLRLLFISITLVSLVAFSCGGPKKLAEPEGPAVKEVQELPADTSTKKSSANRERIESKETWTGSEIVAESVGRMKSKLALNSVTTEKVDDILTSAFLSIGGNLSKSYPVIEARDLGKKIIRNSVEPIMVILDDTQKAEFKKLLQN